MTSCGWEGQCAVDGRMDNLAGGWFGECGWHDGKVSVGEWVSG